METAFLVPGYSPDRSFADPDFDVLRQEMSQRNLLLRGVSGGWSDHSIQEYALHAAENFQENNNDILIAHSLGALATLSVIDKFSTQHLLLCSPSALFSEDIHANRSKDVYERIGEKRLHELKILSASRTAYVLNQLRIPMTIMFGEMERTQHPDLVARCCYLATEIVGAKLIEVPGASHFIGELPYARELAKLTEKIAGELSLH